jgi:hypothetical protein
MGVFLKVVKYYNFIKQLTTRVIWVQCRYPSVSCLPPAAASQERRVSFPKQLLSGAIPYRRLPRSATRPAWQAAAGSRLRRAAARSAMGSSTGPGRRGWWRGKELMDMLRGREISWAPVERVDTAGRSGHDRRGKGTGHEHEWRTTMNTNMSKLMIRFDMVYWTLNLMLITKLSLNTITKTSLYSYTTL